MIIQITPLNAAAVGVSPQGWAILTDDTLATVTTTGYLNSVKESYSSIYNFDNTQYAWVYTTDFAAVPLQVSVNASGVVSLVEFENQGNVTLPVVSGDFAVFDGTSGKIKDAGYSATNAAKTKVIMANAAVATSHIACFTDTSGTVDDDATTAINAGNLQAGLSGTAGYLASFPATLAKGSLRMVAVANTNDTLVTISNALHAQASVYSIPDVGAATGQFNVVTGALVSGNLMSASGTAGKLQDTGIASSNVVAKNAANTMAAGSSIVLAKVNGVEASNLVTASGVAGVITTSALTTAGAGSYAITWTNTFITTTSNIGLTIQGGTNTTKNFKMEVIPGSGTATLTIYNLTAATALDGTLLIGYTVF